MSNTLDDIEVVLTCPLGHVCQKVVDGKIERCMAFVHFEGKDGEGKDVNEWGCTVFRYNTRLLLEATETNRGQTAAIESFRNDMHSDNAQFLTMAAGAAHRQLTKV